MAYGAGTNEGGNSGFNGGSNNSRPGDPGKKDNYFKNKPRRRKWIDPRGANIPYVEGRESWQGNTKRDGKRAGTLLNKSGDMVNKAFGRGRGRSGNMVTEAEYTRRMGLVETYKKEDLARSKIKPIKDPEGDKSTARRKSAKRKQKGRAGTLLSQGRETLG